jgi:hypothetical protein
VDTTAPPQPSPQYPLPVFLLRKERKENVRNMMKKTEK